MEYSRKALIRLCDKGVVKQKRWRNRDSHGAQIQLATAGAMLKAGCKFNVLTPENNGGLGGCVTTNAIIWIEIWAKDFAYFEGHDDTPEGNKMDSKFYIPTQARLKQVDGLDWY